jgi:hypothetical protein
MESEPSGVEESSDTVDDILTNLKQIAKTVELAVCETRLQMRMIQKKVAAEVVLQPKAKTRAWLAKREKPTTSDVEEFFEVLLEEHALEDRLHLTDRLIELNPDAQQLFGLGKDPVTFPDVLDRLSKVYG